MDRLTTVEKQKLCEENKEVPPTPEAPSDSKDEEDDDESGVKEIPKSVAEGDEAKPSKKGEDKTGQANGDFEVTTDEIFAGCGSIEKM